MKLADFDITFGQDLPFVLIAGPCQIESRDHALMLAQSLRDIAGQNLVFKASYDKANRTSLDGRRGLGIVEGLSVLADVRALGLPVICDVHLPQDCAQVAEVVDILQIPAFLCRQTDLLIAAAKTGKPVMVKKGQFLAPQDMKFVAEKITKNGNPNVLLCERGTSFGYGNLVNDMRALPIMAATGHPVVFDATHSVQMPSIGDGKTGGNRDMVPVLARAAIATGIAGLFVEVHDDPDNAPSDGPNMMRLDALETNLRQWRALDAVIKRA